MTKAETRSSIAVWLLGKPEKDIVCGGLPTKGDVLRKVAFHYVEEHLTIGASAKLAIEAALVYWEKARIPVRRFDAGERQLLKLYDAYKALKRSRHKPSENYRVKEQMFTDDLESLFDISRKDALNTMTNEEDKAFLIMQREDTSSSHMDSVDNSLAEKEKRKRSRIEKEEARKQKHLAEAQAAKKSVPSTSVVVVVENEMSSSDSVSTHSDSDNDFKVSTPSTSTHSRLKRLKKGDKERSTEAISSEGGEASSGDVTDCNQGRSVEEIICRFRQSTMIADAVPASCSNSAMASTSDSKVSLDVKEEEESGSPKSSPIPTNGEVGHDDQPTHQPLKEDDEGHVSSEDEDKLVINEGCEKKESQRQEVAVEGLGSGSQSELSENSPKSPLKRPVEEVDAAEINSKRPFIQEETEESAPSIAHFDHSLTLLKRDLQAIELLLVQKEEEWNSLLRLLKKKEELYIRLVRKRQVMKMGGFEKKEEEGEGEEEESVMFLPQGAYSSLGTSQFPLMMLKQMLGENYVPQVVTSNKPSHTRDSHNSNGPLSSQSNISVIDIHTNNSKPSGASEAPQISISPETHSKLGKQLNSMMSMKPILPKPVNSGGSIMNPGGPLPPLTYPSSGYGPQGPTVSVHHLIAAHRKDNPNIPPIRGAKRGAWRHRYESEKRSSSREPDRPSSVSSSSSETEIRVNASLNSKGGSTSSNTSNSMLTMNDPSVSYKDVLLQFAQLTQTEKQPGSPQISIIPVSAGESSSRKMEPIPDSTSISREFPVQSQTSSQSQNLEGSSALAKLLLESGAGNHGNVSKTPAVDLSAYNNSSPHCLTLSALLSGGTTTTVKDKAASAAQIEVRTKKSVSAEEGNSNPKCQGCHKHRAQFVCAGCGNQWYCSRNCQVIAWEKHSEHCSS